MDLLQPFPMGLTVDFSTRCNLRCTYCATGSAAHVDIDMPDEVLADIDRFCRAAGVRDIWLSASGETTMYPGWDDKLHMFLYERPDYRLHLNSNFARPFTDKDIAALLRFHHIQVSIDSASPQMIKKQRTADLRNIIFNVVRLRHAAILAGSQFPVIHFNCTVTRDNITHIEGLAILALQLMVQRFIITEVAVSDNPNMPDTLDRMSEEEAQAFAHSVHKAAKRFGGFDRVFQPQGALQGKLLPALKAIEEGRPLADVAANFKGSTRTSMVGPCTQPWNTVMVLANGNVTACCGSNETFGNVKEEPIAAIFNGAKARAFRQKILAGGPDIPCATCPIASSFDTATFRECIKWSIEQYQAAGHVYPAQEPLWSTIPA